jgi:predicted  nucleic acid-binding Zn-ribbon protein
MKESELIKTRNKVESLRNVMQTVINKITMLETLVFSMTDIVKRLDQYESIIKQIQSERERDTKKIKK